MRGNTCTCHLIMTVLFCFVLCFVPLHLNLILSASSNHENKKKIKESSAVIDIEVKLIRLLKN